jgi:hypothetical protein
LVWNAATEVFWRRDARHYLPVRYEDFVEKPIETVRQILHMLGKPPLDVDMTADREVYLDVCHTVDGNPVRLQKGFVRLEKDVEWETAMDLRTKGAVTLMTLPLLLRYHYPVRPVLQTAGSRKH